MFRIIASGVVDTRVARKAIHATPRRYKSLDSAIQAAKRKMFGVFEVMDDSRNTVAVIRDGKCVACI